jgi:hypothetical protein
MFEPPPRVVVRTDLVPAPPAPPAENLPAPTAEQVRMADSVFVPTAENQAAAAILGMWTGTMALHGLLVDHLQRPREEEEDRPLPDLLPEEPGA